MIDQADSPQANKQLVLRFFELFTANRIPESMSLLATDATWWVAGPAGRLKVAGLKNHAQIERLLGSVLRMLPKGMQLTIKGMTAEADRVAVEAEACGDTVSGKTYHNCYHILFEVRSGLIVAVREYMDTLHLYDVLQA